MHLSYADPMQRTAFQHNFLPENLFLRHIVIDGWIGQLLNRSETINGSNILGKWSESSNGSSILLCIVIQSVTILHHLYLFEWTPVSENILDILRRKPVQV